jgi:hypothetical protein
MSRAILFTLLVSSLAGLSACGRKNTAQMPTDLASLREVCPVAQGNVSVQVADTDDGVALTFTTAGGDVDDLQRRVESLAAMYEQQDGRTDVMWHAMGMGATDISASTNTGSYSTQTQANPQDSAGMGIGAGGPGATAGGAGDTLGTSTPPGMAGSPDTALGTTPGTGTAATGYTQSGDTAGTMGTPYSGTPGLETTDVEGPLPAADADVERVEQGARLVLKPKEAAELDMLRQVVHAHGMHMQAGECWMPRTAEGMGS